MSVFSR
jgi:hypothetical protein